MKSLTATRLDSKGRVVIPERIRDRLGLRTGAQFVVTMGDGEELILRAVSPSSMKYFDELIRQIRREARKAGLRAADIRDAIHRARA